MYHRPETTKSKFTEGVALVTKDKDCRLSLLFAAAFFALSVLSFTISVWSNSLVLNLNGFILLQRVVVCLGVVINRIATSSMMTQSNEGKEFSYGLGRAEVLVQYSGVGLVCFSCLTSVIEGLKKMFEEHDVHPAPVELLCIAHVVTIVAATKPEVWIKAKRRGKRAIAQFVFLESLPPVICFVSAQLIAFTGLSRLDILFAMFLTGGTVVNGLDSLRKTSSVLLQQSPAAIRSVFDKAVREVAVIEGVLECRQADCWALTEGQLVATLKLRLSADASESRVVRAVEDLMAPLVSHLTVDVDVGTSKGSAPGSNNSSAAVAGGGYMYPVPGPTSSSASGTTHYRGHGHQQHTSSGATGNDTAAAVLGSSSEGFYQQIPMFPVAPPPQSTGSAPAATAAPAAVTTTSSGSGSGSAGSGAAFPLPPSLVSTGGAIPTGGTAPLSTTVVGGGAPDASHPPPPLPPPPPLSGSSGSQGESHRV